MSGIPRVGVTLLATLGVVAVVSVGARLAARGIGSRQEIPIPPERIGKWVRSSSSPPAYDRERDRPAARYFVYQQGDKPPVLVSIARAETLNAYREPAYYLLGSNGRVPRGQEARLAREGEKMPVYRLQIALGLDDSIALMHWGQAAGDDPMFDPTDAPGRIAQTLLLKQPYYICDVWLPLRSDLNVPAVDKLLMEFTAEIDRLIKSGGSPKT